jgi:hypothetical protein
MSHAPAAGTDSVTEPRPAGVTPSVPAFTRRQLVAWTVLGLLLPISVLTALIVVAQMAGSAAAATGGCGGG